MQERVPRAVPEDAPQRLSAPQRTLLLAALGRLPEASLRAELAHRLEPAPAKAEPALRLAALRVLGVIGGRGDYRGLAALVPRAGEEPTPEGAEALRAAYATILRREPELLENGIKLLRPLDPEAGKQLLFALADLRDKRALPLFDECIRALPGYAQQAVALLPAIGRSGDPDLDQPLAAWLAERLDPERMEWTRAAIRAIGCLDDGSQIATLIGMLESPQRGLREAALSALRQISGLGLGSSVDAWREWHARELAWLDTERPLAEAALAGADDASAVAALAAYAQRRLFRDELVADVLPVLESESSVRRAMGCRTLGQLGSTRALEALAPLAADEDENVARAAHEALVAIRGRDPAQPGRDPNERP